MEIAPGPGTSDLRSVSVRHLSDFWTSEYLDWYVKNGGSKVKMVTSREAERKTEFLESIRDLASSRGYAAYLIDAGSMDRLKLTNVYQAVVSGMDLSDLISSFSKQLVRRMGYDPAEIEPCRSFVDWVTEVKLRDRISVCREIKENLEATLFRNPAVNRTFATAVIRLCLDHLGALDLPVDLEGPSLKETLFSWMRAEDVPMRALRRQHVYVRIDRYNARVMLRSLAEVAKMAGKTGLVLMIDGLEILLGRRENGRPLYTRSLRDEFYESVRQFVDEVEEFNYTMIVLGFTRELVDDMACGLRSYEALWLRIQNEVEGDLPNLFRDLVDLDLLDEAGDELAAAGKESLIQRVGPVESRYTGAREARRDFDATKIVETLRSGVTSPKLAAAFCYGREALLEKTGRDLSAVKGDGDPRGIVIRGEYGEGKTHFLNAVMNEALKARFAVSLVVLSKETPFNRMDKVYPRLISNTFLPGENEPGIIPLFRDLRPDGPEAQYLLDLAETELNPKVYHVLYDYLYAADAYIQYLLEGDLSGTFLPTSTVKSIHRTTAGQPAKIRRFSPKANTMDYIRLISEAIKIRGYSGWVILFDEFELVGSLGPLARADAYLNMVPFLGLPGSPHSLESTLTVFSIAGRYWSDILLRDRRPETEEIPRRLDVRGRTPDARTVERVFKILLTRAVTLDMLTEAEVGKMLSALAATHGRAYSWDARLNVREALDATKHARLRTRIRYALEKIDLEYLYNRESEVATRELEEIEISESEL